LHSYGASPAILDHPVSGVSLSPDTGERAPPRLNPSQTGRYSIYLPQRDEKLS